jgi:hypothetical protein
MWSGIKTILTTNNPALTTELSSSDCQVTEDLIIKYNVLIVQLQEKKPKYTNHGTCSLLSLLA